MWISQFEILSHFESHWCFSSSRLSPNVSPQYLRIKTHKVGPKIYESEQCKKSSGNNSNYLSPKMFECFGLVSNNALSGFGLDLLFISEGDGGWGSRLPCLVFCICMLTNKYQKYKLVDLGDQLGGVSFRKGKIQG